MEQSPSSEADSHSASQEIPWPSYNPKIHYHVHNNPPLFLILSQVNPGHAFLITPILSFHLRLSLSNGLFSFSNQNIVCIFNLYHACYMPCPSHRPCFCHPNNIFWTVKVMKLLIMQSSPVSSLPPFMSKCSPQHPVLCFLLSVGDHVTHPYKTRGKIIVLFILIFMFLQTRSEDKRMWTEWRQAFLELNLLLICFLYTIFTCYGCSQVFELYHIFKEFVSYS
jgi:hypothetical protein